MATCSECGANFAPTSHNQKCCSRQCAHKRAARTRSERLRAARDKDRLDREARFAARDAEYAKLNVPVTVRYEGNVRIEYRGQPHVGSSCGTIRQSDALYPET